MRGSKINNRKNGGGLKVYTFDLKATIHGQTQAACVLACRNAFQLSSPLHKPFLRQQDHLCQASWSSFESLRGKYRLLY
jgi:hypothetical protein